VQTLIRVFDVAPDGSLANARVFASGIRSELEPGVPDGMLINVNFPACAATEAAGVAATVQGQRDTELVRVEERRDGRAIPYFWLMFRRGGFPPAEGSDIAALAARKVSITPLRLDLTDEATRQRYAEAFGSR